MVQILILFITLAAFSFLNIRYPWIKSHKPIKIREIDDHMRGGINWTFSLPIALRE